MLLPFLLVLVLGDLDRDLEGVDDLALADAMRVVPTMGAIAANTPRTCSASMPISLAAEA